MKLNPQNPNELISRIQSSPLVIYGMGYVGNLIAAWCTQNKISYSYCDRNAEQMKCETDREIVLPSQLKDKYSEANIVVASINYYDEIKASLIRLGYDEDSILSYLLFWSPRIPWLELEESVDWVAVRERASLFAAWIEQSTKSVFDFSIERNYLKEFLPRSTRYYAPNYVQYREFSLLADFSQVDDSLNAEVSSCLAVLMSFENPDELIAHMCRVTLNSIIVSYVTVEKLSDINLRRSINYVNDFTENELIHLFLEKGFILEKFAADPFDEVHTVYLFKRKI